MADQPSGQNNQNNKGGGYGKRPLWQWIVLYVIIGGIIYLGIYYFAVHHSGGSLYGGSSSSAPY